MTSPSIIEYSNTLYICFLGWDNSPYEVTEVWVIGATSTNNGHTWSNFQIIDTPIGMEGQITFDPVSGEEYIFYTGADHEKGW